MSKSTILKTAKLRQSAPTPISFVPDANTRTQIARDLDLIKLSKLSFTGEVALQGENDWELTAKLGATVVQPCVVTLEPVTTRIDQMVTRTYVADWMEPEDSETEMLGDETVEPLGETIDVAQVAQEALALALPDFPKAPDAGIVEITATPPGAEALTEEKIKPFAGLAALKEKLERGE